MASMCMCNTHTHTYTHTCIHICIHTHMHTHIRSHTHTHTHVYTYTNTHIHTHIHILGAEILSKGEAEYSMARKICLLSTSVHILCVRRTDGHPLLGHMGSKSKRCVASGGSLGTGDRRGKVRTRELAPYLVAFAT